MGRLWRMDLTTSYESVFASRTLARYQFREVRNAAAILKATNPRETCMIEGVLNDFKLLSSDLIDAGGSESALAKRINGSFRTMGWREARVDTDIELKLRIFPYRPAGERAVTESSTLVSNEGYKVDNFTGRIALDLEWNAKDGNLDRDIGAYRALYDAGLIDAAVLITRTQADLRELGTRLRIEAGIEPEEARKVLATSTTTNIDKLLPRMTRGDGGGCPILAVAICAETWEDSERSNSQI
ncbi:restriction endonuclease BglII [Microbacterium lacticum]|uniref:Restriction endonuclease BglII n=2 Tax=Microbacterium lacticum TaxID=33885 RepID=A0A543K7D3_9MICO|nr:restriction endonuclease BglII [Microbacterium lacticum]